MPSKMPPEARCEGDSERPAPVAAEDVRLEKPFAEEQAAADKVAADKSAMTRAQLVSLPAASNHLQATANKALRVLVCSLAAWARCSLTSGRV